MTECTPARSDRRQRRWPLRFAACAALVLLVASGGLAGQARADGDPASDVLATQRLFLPQDAGIPAGQQAQLQQLLDEAARGGYPLRLALIASPTDLGSITALWRQPASYAKFLGQELSLTYRGLLLVIMPDGFGVYSQGRSTAAETSTLSTVPIHHAGVGLATTAVQAVRRMAAAAGHSLPLPQATGRRSGGSNDTISWIAFGIGLAIIGAAWAASLRIRPLKSGDKGLPAS